MEAVGGALEQNFAHHDSGKKHWKEALQALQTVNTNLELRMTQARLAIDAFAYYYILDAYIWIQNSRLDSLKDVQPVRGSEIPHKLGAPVCGSTLYSIITTNLIIGNEIL